MPYRQDPPDPPHPPDDGGPTLVKVRPVLSLIRTIKKPIKFPHIRHDQSMPHLRPMATVVADSVAYGFDEDGGSIHDVIGTRRLISR